MAAPNECTTNLPRDAGGRYFLGGWDGESFRALRALAEGLLRVSVGNVQAGGLAVGRQTRPAAVECVLADTDYDAGEVPAWARYALVWSDKAVAVAYGETTTATVGVLLPAAAPQTLPLDRASPGDDRLHVQSPEAGAKVYASFLADMA